ncbi:MAG TPA: mechanosensitive ion channel domain-containing protein [Burkholderiaceae bacterium]|nr:mechanosensitive ion channel domain-containing protein [Burkholderiaceae bacterium]
MKKIETYGLILVALIVGHAGNAFSQVVKPPAPPAAPAAAAATDASAAPVAPPQAIALPDVAAQAEATAAQLRQLESRNRVDDLIDSVAVELPVLSQDLAFRAREMQPLLSKNSTLEAIRNQEGNWRDIELRAAAITQDLTRGALQLDDDFKELEKLESTWDATTKAAVEAKAPPAVLERTREIRNSIGSTKKKVLDNRAKVLSLQGKSADVGARAKELRQILAGARERAVTRLLYQDSLPLWNLAYWTAWINSFSNEARQDLASQGAAVVEYAQSRSERFGWHLVFFLGLAVLLSAAREKIRRLDDAGGNLQRAGKVLDMPVVSAMLIAMLVSTWIYPRAPRTMWVIVSVLGAAPVFIFVRRMIDVSLYPILCAVIGFYLSDRVRDLLAPLPGVSRLMLLAESLLVILFCRWTLRKANASPNAPVSVHASVWRVIRLGIWLVFFFFIVALGSNIGGYVRLADLIVRTTLGSVYTAVVFYALMRVGEGMVQGLMSLPPVSMLGMVKRHKMLLISRINRLLRWIAVLFWIGITLQGPGILQPLLASVQSFWKVSLRIGTFALTVENIFLFFFVLWAAVTLSRLARFVLTEEVFPKLRLERGLPYAVTTMLHYVLLLSGLVLAVGALGVDMTKFTIVASAFSVGIGFGLQNVVNNFVSGLIVLFERPIKVGDVIQIDDVIGRVQRIGIRASVVLSTAGSEVIIPNGKLISDKVTNWTLSNQLRQISVSVITKPDIDVVALQKLLPQIARKNKWVAETPAPQALFIKRGLDTLEFELRAWTGELDTWVEVRSDLTTDVNQALRAHDIAAQASSPSPVPARP